MIHLYWILAGGFVDFDPATSSGLGINPAEILTHAVGNLLSGPLGWGLGLYVAVQLLSVLPKYFNRAANGGSKSKAFSAEDHFGKRAAR